MKPLLNIVIYCFVLITGVNVVEANSSQKFNRPTANQTDTLSPVLPETNLPFSIVITQATFQLPVGFHSGVVGVYKGQWVFIAGRINGLHGFDPSNNFPADAQNTSIYVVNPNTGGVSFRSLSDPSSGLTQQQIDTLTVTSPQYYQEANTLYMTGGYGIDTPSSTFGTKPVLTAINLPGIVNWVTQPNNKNNSVAANIRQLYDSTFQITGGVMHKLGNVTQLIFGQNFTGEYTDGSNGDYSQQISRFVIKNANGQLAAERVTPSPASPNANYRRRDLNIVPTLLNNNNRLIPGLIAYAGVFTLTSGVWTVPVIINGTSDPIMADPTLPSTFKQAMNQYVCATASLYSRKYTSMYHLFFGGISYGFFANGSFATDSEIPFINQVTTVQMDKNGNFTQYLMNNEYPVILSTGSNPGNPLLFGAGAYFIPTNILQYPNGVISLDNIRKPIVIGYIIGGIQSTLANTNFMSDSSASPYVFTVTLVPKTKFASRRQGSTQHTRFLVEPPLSPVALPSVNLAQTYNRKYHGLASQLMSQ